MHRVRLLRPALLAALSAVTVVACGSLNPPSQAESSPHKAQHQQEARKRRPVPDRTDTIAGVDASRDGVRDDIEAWSARLPDNEEQKYWLGRVHTAVTNSMLVDVKDEYALREVANDITLTTDCQMDAYPPDTLLGYHRGAEIEKLTVNTRARKKAYRRFNASQNGTVSFSYPHEACIRP